MRNVFTLINQRAYAKALTSFRRLDTFARGGFPGLLIDWLKEKAQEADSSPGSGTDHGRKAGRDGATPGSSLS